VIILQIGLKGTQSKTYCSMPSSIGHCERLSTQSERCLQYKRKLEYDWDTRAYIRCEECLLGEVK